MRSPAVLTGAAATAASLGGLLARAGAAAATTAPATPPMTPAVPTQGIQAVEKALELGDNWCVTPLHWSGPLVSDPFPDPGNAAPTRACRSAGRAGSGFGILRNVSVASVQTTF